MVENNCLFFYTKQPEHPLLEGVRAMFPPEPLGKGGICEAAPIPEVQSSKPLCNLSNLRAKQQSGGSRR